MEHLFHHALALGFSEREGFLDEQCRDDARLRRSVASLLLLADSETLRLTLGDRFPDDLPTLECGLTIDHFKLLEQIGSGGMGSVWLCEDLLLKRRVALKLLHGLTSTHADLLAEAQAASQLNHLNIVAVYEFGEFEGRSYIVSEYVDGANLRSRLNGKPVPFDQIVSIGTPFISMLKHVHAAGIIHRDLKPENILIDSDDRPRLTDFGLASRAGSCTGPLLVGTPAYMSPEQICGEPPTSQTDIWSLGVVLFEMATGRQPFQGICLAETLELIGTQELPSLDKCDSGFACIIRTALEKDCARRYSSVVDLERDWLAMLQARQKRRGRKRRLIYVSCVAAAAASIGLIFSREFNRPAADSGWFVPTQVTRPTSSGDVLSAAVSPNGKWVAIINEKGDTITAKELITGRVVDLTWGRNLQFSNITFSPDSAAVYYLQDNLHDFRTLYASTISTRARTRIVEDVDSPSAFSPDGRHIAFTRDSPAERRSLLIMADRNGRESHTIFYLPWPQRFSFNGGGLDVRWKSDPVGRTGFG